MPTMSASTVRVCRTPSIPATPTSVSISTWDRMWVAPCETASLACRSDCWRGSMGSVRRAVRSFSILSIRRGPTSLRYHAIRAVICPDACAPPGQAERCGLRRRGGGVRVHLRSGRNLRSARYGSAGWLPIHPSGVRWSVEGRTCCRIPFGKSRDQEWGRSYHGWAVSSCAASRNRVAPSPKGRRIARRPGRAAPAGGVIPIRL
jgi:hypothetical protein